MEADDDKRAEYLKNIQEIPLDKRVYIDESGLEMNLVKERGWAKVGARLIGKKSGKYYQRTNIVAGYVNKRHIAPLLFKKTCNSELFNQWLAKELLPALKPGQVVIMDNAQFHKSEKTKELIKKAQCKLLYLPAYSPDLNPIEKYWAKMKRWLRENRDRFNSLLDALNHFLVVT